MDIEVVKKAILDWIKKETGFDSDRVIYARQSKQRPDRPYASILFVNPGSRLGSVDQLTWEEPDSKFVLSGLRSSLISINIIGDGANNTMSKLLNTLDRPDVIDDFYEAGFSVMGENGPNDLTELLETKWEERSQMDLEINYAHNTTTDVGTIENVEIESETDIGI